MTLGYHYIWSCHWPDPPPACGYALALGPGGWSTDTQSRLCHVSLEYCYEM